MRAIRTDSSNFTYVGPHPEIGDLPCRRDDGAVYAVWQLSDEERAMIANGAQIELGVFTEPIPPVSMRIVNEPEVPEEDDLRCVRCSALYRSDRGMSSCGWCGGRLEPSPAAAADPRGAAAVAPVDKPQVEE